MQARLWCARKEKLGVRQRNDGGKQFVIELPAEAGADLCNLFHHRCEASLTCPATQCGLCAPPGGAAGS
jgi:hypothetical protein